MANKVDENRVRRMAQRQGLTLSKSRRRDPWAHDYGGYMLVDTQLNLAVAGASPFAFSLSLEEAETWLTTPDDED